MRRLIIAPLKEHFKNSDGTGLTFLEIAAGTGRTTKFVKLAFPKAKIVVLDLSDPYLKHAQQVLKDQPKIDFVQGAAEKLPFSDETFDAVYSVFLFHELPLDTRTEVINESKRVLKKQGLFGFVDSIQKDDFKPFNPLLENFPKDFHEPFYRNYYETPMSSLLSKVFKKTDQSIGFLSKAMTAIKD